MSIRVHLLIRILLTTTAVLAVAAGVAAPAGAAAVPVAALSAPDSAVSDPPHNPYLDVVGTPSCDRRGHASVMWKLTSTIGVTSVDLTSPDAVKPVGSTIETLPGGNAVLLFMRQSIPGTHGKGTASVEVQGLTRLPDDSLAPVPSQGSVHYDCAATLPVTGSGAATYVVVGGILAAIGLILVLLARPRRTRSEA